MNCPKAMQDLKKRRKVIQCRFTTPQPVVCCEPLDSPKPPPPLPFTGTNSSWPSPAGSKSKQKCREYAEFVFVKSPGFIQAKEEKIDTCVIGEPLITEGENAQPREYPHMALIGYGNRDSIEWLCGGSLISRRFVISAGHCTDSGTKGLARWVRLGDYDISTTSDDKQNLSKSEQYEIIERINHPDYQSPIAYHDLALYRLNREVHLNEYIRPICLHTGDNIAGDGYALATGWGSLGWLRKGSKVLQKVKLQLKPFNVCKVSYRAGPKLQNGIQESSQFCAGDSINGGDTCPGDSGGPLQAALETPYCMYSLIGVTSLGGKPCGGNRPSVFTRVSNYVSWIESIVWP
ncbi:serine protease snake-like [Homalodisca vitripennis]|uniref:serine protease snake-like n=1 Tax=Homalodisca vitripennis TaxID=197043 RepID=UPI001EEAE824|nr:serine protease snake-like [Homalodisca vitripennis]